MTLHDADCKLSIVIPCYNEASRLNQDEFRRYLAASPQMSLVFVNDGSTDHTLEILQSLKAGMPAQIDVLDKKVNAGKGEAVRSGLLRAIQSGALMSDSGTLISRLL